MADKLPIPRQAGSPAYAARPIPICCKARSPSGTMRKTRMVHSKSRTGCLTCKKRRVKCDETKPVCNRCLSTKRMCDGYSIMIDVPKRPSYQIARWEYARSVSDIQPKPLPATLPALDPTESRIFEAFRSKAIPELAGLRSAGFWRNVVLPACYSEPAILHASIALACATKLRCQQKASPGDNAYRATELISVAEYNKAITHLKEVMKHENSSSMRIMLIACVIFTAIEIFSGCVGKAIMHLDNGRKLLLQLHRFHRRCVTTPEPESKVTRLLFSPKPESVEDKLVNMFAHLDLQSTYFGCEKPLLNLAADEKNTTTPPEGFGPNSNSPTSLVVPSNFRSLHEANQYLVILINECLKYTGQAFVPTRNSIHDEASNFHRQHLSSSLRQWRQAYAHPTITATQMERSDPTWKSQAALMLIHHAWLSIMIPTSYIEVEETNFDSYSRHFTTIVDLITFIFSPEGEGASLNRKHFALELGVVPPLFWTIMKCRHPKLRRKALWLLGEIGREGLWDPMIVHQTGIETILLEEPAPQSMVLGSSWASLHADGAFDEKTDSSIWVPLERRISLATLPFVDEDLQVLRMTFQRKLRDESGRWTGDFEHIVRERPLEPVSK